MEGLHLQCSSVSKGQRNLRSTSNNENVVFALPPPWFLHPLPPSHPHLHSWLITLPIFSSQLLFSVFIFHILTLSGTQCRSWKSDMVSIKTITWSWSPWLCVSYMCVWRKTIDQGGTLGAHSHSLEFSSPCSLPTVSSEMPEIKATEYEVLQNSLCSF